MRKYKIIFKVNYTWKVGYKYLTDLFRLFQVYAIYFKIMRVVTHTMYVTS